MSEPMASNTWFITAENPDCLCTYIVKYTIWCHIYEFKKIQNTSKHVRATQDIPKSATEVTWDFSQVVWLPGLLEWRQKRIKWLGGEIPCDLGFKIGDRKRALVLSALHLVQFWINSYHIWHKWSLAWECVAHNLWSWLIYLMLFSCDVAFFMDICGTSATHEWMMCHVPIPGQ